MEIVTIFSSLAKDVVAIILLVSGFAKLFGLKQFVAALLPIPYMRESLTWPIAIIIPSLEILASLGIFCGNRSGHFMAIFLIIIFEIVIAISLWRKLTIACNCFGSLSSRTMSWGTFSFNLLLLIFVTLPLVIDGVVSDFFSLTTSAGVFLVFLVIRSIRENQHLIRINYEANRL